MTANKTLKLKLNFIRVDYNSNKIINTEKELDRMVLVEDIVFKQTSAGQNSLLYAIVEDNINDQTDFSAYAKVVNVKELKLQSNTETIRLTADVVVYSSMPQSSDIKRFNEADAEG